MSDDFNVNRGGKQEKLNKFKQGIKKEQLDAKHSELFNIFDENQDGQLSKEELTTVDNILSISAGSNKILDESENNVANSLFAKTLNVENTDFMGFVKSLSEASANMPEEQSETPVQDIDITKVQQKWDPVYQELREALRQQLEENPSHLEEVTVGSFKTNSDENPTEYYYYDENGKIMKKIAATSSKDSDVTFIEYSRYVKDGEEFILVSKLSGEYIVKTLVKKINEENGNYDDNDKISTTAYDFSGNIVSETFFKDGRISLQNDYDDKGVLFSTSTYEYDVNKGDPADGLYKRVTEYFDGREKDVWIYDPNALDYLKRSEYEKSYSNILRYMNDLGTNLKSGKTMPNYDQNAMQELVSKLNSGINEFDIAGHHYIKTSDEPLSYEYRDSSGDLCYSSSTNKIYKTKHNLTELADSNDILLHAGPNMWLRFNSEGKFICSLVGIKENDKDAEYKEVRSIYPDGRLIVCDYLDDDGKNHNLPIHKNIYMYNKATGGYDLQYTINNIYSEDDTQCLEWELIRPKSDKYNPNETHYADGNIVYWHWVGDAETGHPEVDAQRIATSVRVTNEKGELVGYEELSSMYVEQAGGIRYVPAVDLHSQKPITVYQKPELDTGEQCDMFLAENRIRAAFFDTVTAQIQTLISTIEAVKNGQIPIIDASWWRQVQQKIWLFQSNLFTAPLEWLGVVEDSKDIPIIGDLQQILEDNTYSCMITKWKDLLDSIQKKRYELVYDDSVLYRTTADGDSEPNYDKIKKIIDGKDSGNLVSSYSYVRGEFARFYNEITGENYSESNNSLEFYAEKQDFLRFDNEVQALYMNLKEAYDKKSPTPLSTFAKPGRENDLYNQFITEMNTPEPDGAGGDITKTSLFCTVYSTYSKKALAGTDIVNKIARQNGIIKAGQTLDTILDIASLFVGYGIVAKSVAKVIKGAKVLFWGSKAGELAFKLGVKLATKLPKLTKTLAYVGNAVEQGVSLGVTMGSYDALGEGLSQIRDGEFDLGKIRGAFWDGFVVGGAAGTAMGLITPAIIKLAAPEILKEGEVVQGVMTDALASVQNGEKVTIAYEKFLEAMAKNANVLSLDAPTSVLSFFAEVATFTGASIGYDLLNSDNMQKILAANGKTVDESMGKIDLMKEVMSLRGIDTSNMSDFDVLTTYSSLSFSDQVQGLGKLKIAGFIISRRMGMKKDFKAGKYTRKMNIEIEYKDGKYYEIKDNGRKVEVNSADIASRIQMSMALDILDQDFKPGSTMTGKDIGKAIFGAKTIAGTDSKTTEKMKKLIVKREGDEFIIKTSDGKEIKTDNLEIVLDTFISELKNDTAVDDARVRAQADWEERQNGAQPIQGSEQVQPEGKPGEVTLENPTHPVGQPVSPVARPEGQQVDGIQEVTTPLGKKVYVKPTAVRLVDSMQEICKSDGEISENSQAWQRVKDKAQSIINTIVSKGKVVWDDIKQPLGELYDMVENFTHESAVKFKALFATDKPVAKLANTRPVSDMSVEEVVADLPSAIENGATTVFELKEHINMLESQGNEQGYTVFKHQSEIVVRKNGERVFTVSYDNRGNVVKYHDGKNFYIVDKSGQSVEVKDLEWDKVQSNNPRSNPVTDYIMFDSKLPELVRDLILEDTSHRYDMDDIKQLENLLKTEDDVKVACKILSTRGSEKGYLRVIGKALNIELLQKFSIKDLVKILESECAKQSVLEDIRNNSYTKKSDLESKLNNGVTFEAFKVHKMNEEADLSYETVDLKSDELKNNFGVRDGVTDFSKEYEENTTFREKLNAKVPDGEVVCLDGKMYCRAAGKLVPINLPKETFERLFPISERYNTKQGARLGDCYFISVLGGYMATPAGRATIYSLFSEVNGDIYIRFPGYEYVQVKFEGGKLNKLSPVSIYKINGKWKIGTKYDQVNACDGIKMIEQAFAFVRNNYDLIADKTIVANNKFYMNKQMQNTVDSNPDWVSEISDLFGNSQLMATHLPDGRIYIEHPEQSSLSVEQCLESLADELETNPNAYGEVSFDKELSISNDSELLTGHSYLILGYNKVAGTVLLANPHDLSEYREVPLKDFKEANPRLCVYNIGTDFEGNRNKTGKNPENTGTQGDKPPEGAKPKPEVKPGNTETSGGELPGETDVTASSVPAENETNPGVTPPLPPLRPNPISPFSYTLKVIFSRAVREWVRRLESDPKFPKEEIKYIKSTINESNLELAKKLCEDSGFPKERIAYILQFSDSVNTQSKIRIYEMLKNSGISEEALADVILTTDAYNFEARVEIYNKYSKNIKGQTLASLIMQTNAENVKLVDKLFSDKTIHVDAAFSILNLINIYNDPASRKTLSEDLLNNPEILKFINSEIRENGSAATVWFGNTPVNGKFVFNIIYSSGKSGSISLSRDANGKLTAGVEEISNKPNKPNVNRITHTYSDGSKIVEEIEYESTYPNSQRAVCMRKTWYDSEGNATRSEVYTPIKDRPGEYRVNVYERGLNKSMRKTQQVRVERSNGNTKVTRDFESPDGTKTVQRIIENGNGCYASHLDIQTADGTPKYNKYRQHRKIAENKYETTIILLDQIGDDRKPVQRKFTVEFGDYDLSVKDENGNVIVKYDTTVLNPKLIELFEKLPADYYIRMKQAGITGFDIDYSKKWKNNAYYDSVKRKIMMSPELASDPFVAIHELGHMIDLAVVDKCVLRNPEIKSLFRQEQAAYTHESTNAEHSANMGYFSDEYYKCGLMEIAAEVVAIESGVRHDNVPNFLYMRSIELQKYFPKTAAAILKAIDNVGFDIKPA